MISIILQAIYAFLKGPIEKQTRDQCSKSLFSTFKSSIVPFFNQFGNYNFIGSFDKLENIEIIGPSIGKTVTDFIFRTIVPQIVNIEFQSTRYISCLEHYLVKTGNIRFINKYSVPVFLFIVFLPLLNGGEKKIEDQINRYFKKYNSINYPYFIYISDLRFKKDEVLNRVSQNVKNNVQIDDLDLMDLCVFPTLYSNCNNYNELNDLITISYSAFNLISDKVKKFSCLNIFFGFLKFYCRKYCKYLLSQEGVGKMKFLSDYVNEIVVNPLKSSYDLALSQKDEALCQKDEALSQKDEALSQKDEALSKAYAALKNYAKRLLKQGLAKEEVSNETTLPPETVEELSLELGFKN
jgi:hypothetical protein